MANPTRSSLINPTFTVNNSLKFSNTTRESEDQSLVSNDASTIVGAIILSLVFLIGVPGNLFIIWSILARSRKRSVTTLLILNLACADGFLMALTIFFVVYLAKQTWIFSSFLCKTLFYLCNVNMYASIMLITLMSLHRLVAVVWPHHIGAFSKKRTVLRVLAGLWVSVLVLALPALIFREVREDTAERGRTRFVCAPNHVRSSEASAKEGMVRTKRAQEYIFCCSVRGQEGMFLIYVQF